MKSYYTLLIIFFVINVASSQTDTIAETSIKFHINSNIKNAEEDYFKKIENNWKAYISSQEYVRNNNIYWSYEKHPFPDYAYISLLLDLNTAINDEQDVQCTILGIIPAENDYFLLKTMFSQKDEHSGLADVKYIISVYAKKTEDQYLFINSIQYHEEIYENKIIGDINYIIHPDHQFKEKDAQKMNEFNKWIAAKFEVPPLKFDYVLANNTNDLSEVIGLDFFAYSYQPVPSGGMADNYNTMIFAGNNSAYYPHEVVHLYTNLRFRRQYHTWIDEGIAAYFGGSTGYKIEWHIQKLKKFLEKNPEYPLNNLSELQTDIPNGEYTTDFRYAIGGFLCGKIYDNEGMTGLFEALQSGRTDGEYFAIMESKLGFKKEEFGTYIKAELRKLKTLSENEMLKLKY